MVFWIVQQQHGWIGDLNFGNWVDFAANAHCSTAIWKSSLTAKAAAEWLIVIQSSGQFLYRGDDTTSHLYHKLSNIYQSLSVITITITDEPEESTKDHKSVIKARSVSSSIVPCFVPFPILVLIGLAFFWVPFSDGGCNEGYLLQIDAIFRGKKVTTSKISPLVPSTTTRSRTKPGQDLIPSSVVFFLSFIACPVAMVVFLMLL